MKAILKDVNTGVIKCKTVHIDRFLSENWNSWQMMQVWYVSEDFSRGTVDRLETDDIYDYWDWSSESWEGVHSMIVRFGRVCRVPRVGKFR